MAFIYSFIHSFIDIHIWANKFDLVPCFMDGCGRHLAKLKTIWPKNIEVNGDNVLPFMFAVPKISIYINGFYIILNIIAICPFFRLFLFGHKLVETVYGGNCFDTRNRTALPTTMIY